MSEQCTWHLYDDNFFLWGSECGLDWYMGNEDTPKENQMNYCPKCGRELVEELEEWIYKN